MVRMKAVPSVSAIGLAFALAFLTLAPYAAAQPAGYPGCSESPETCDPRTVNGGTSTGDEPVTTILYAHVNDIIQKSPMNTQPPDPEYEHDLKQGILMPTVYMDSDQAPCCKFKSNQFVFFGSPGIIDYGVDGNWRVHQDPGIQAPLHLVDDIVGFAYFSAGSPPDRARASEEQVGVMPAVGVYMRVETGRHPYGGTLIAEGETGIGYGSPDPTKWQSTTTMVNRPDQDPVYEFAIRLPVQTSALGPEGDEPGYIVTMVPYQMDTDGQGEVTSADWRIRTGAEYPHRIHVTTKPPVYDAGAQVLVYDDLVRFRWAVLAAFGYYDVDGTTVTFRLEGPVGPDGTRAEVPTELAHVRFPYNAHGIIEPLNFSWTTVDPVGELSDGEYHASASVLNLQGTYRLERNATILLEDGVPRLAADGETLAADEEAPAAGAAVVAAALIGALLLGRPRRRSGKP